MMMNINKAMGLNMEHKQTRLRKVPDTHNESLCKDDNVFLSGNVRSCVRVMAFMIKV